MFKLLLMSIVIVPVVLGTQAARVGRRRGAFLLLALVVTYDVFYVVLLYYLRVRWVGWGPLAG
jgi:hypothetical protein